MSEQEAVRTPHGSRFQVITGALIVLGVAALALAVALAATTTGGRTSEGARWAAFEPTSTGLDSGARQIAAYVAGQYRQPSGEQLVVITGGPLQFCGSAECLPMKIAVRKSPADGGDIDLLDGRGVLYRLCGLGEKCALDKGKPTPERHLLLRREALELALYSFHDLDDVDHVVVFMPPAKGKDPSQALHFDRDAIAGQLSRPLRATLPAPAPTPDTVTKSPDTAFVHRLTLSSLFKFSLTPGNQDANVFLVLDPLPTES